MNTPIVSIIIATYNSDKTIRTALNSILSQEYKMWECIVVDGVSKDKTIDIVKEFELKDKRFRHISEPDKGVYDAFNKGWKMADGEWIHYLGDDDRLTPDGIKILLDHNTDDIDVISGHCYIEKIDGHIKPNYSIGLNGCHQGKLTRRSVLENYNGFDMQFSVLADLDLMIRMEKAGVKILNVDTFVAYFSMTGISQRICGLWKRTIEYYTIYRKNNCYHPFVSSAKYFLKSFFSILYRKVKGSLIFF